MALRECWVYIVDMVSKDKYAPLQILLVEDNLTFATSVKAFLAQIHGVAVVGHAINGPEAIAKTLQLHPHLLLMDIGLQGMNGFEIANTILDLKQPPMVVFLSMHDGEAYRRQAKKTGADGFISKATFSTDLFPLLDQLVEKRLMH
jgi:DNA-binding NarL/FixJ family response regulator